LQTKAENDRRPPPSAIAPDPATPGEKQDSRQRRGDRRRETRAEFVFPEEAIARDLRPVNERRFIEAVFVVEIRDDVIATLTHLARGLGKARLVPVYERDVPGAGDVQKQAANEDQGEIADCGWQSGDSKIGTGEIQTGNSGE
jgi:hypothetical protein